MVLNDLTGPIYPTLLYIELIEDKEWSTVLEEASRVSEPESWFNKIQKTPWGKKVSRLSRCYIGS